VFEEKLVLDRIVDNNTMDARLAELCEHEDVFQLCPL